MPRTIRLLSFTRDNGTVVNIEYVFQPLEIDFIRSFDEDGGDVLLTDAEISRAFQEILEVDPEDYEFG
jgi:hypothetical protein